ncbi:MULTISPECIES: helix-turn-helix domain-containing protein [unclassified Nocardiopsis]|uniref:helix-turn-helix domain-containing protein n=1 Tax=unclassified Nocardiopsis TaxID=2649073 RepID=UPI00093AD02E|nr:helix-turn-helix domain-containing protein [Nocardiopsis sp. TSRI0078]
MEFSPASPRTPAEYGKRRLIAAGLFDQGELSQAAIACLLGVSRQAVHKWHRAWKDQGPAALAARPCGAEPLLDTEQERALAEAFHSLFEAESVRNRGSWKNLDEVELAVAEYVDWFNHRHLHGGTGPVPPVECEADFYQDESASAEVEALVPGLLKNPAQNTTPLRSHPARA